MTDRIPAHGTAGRYQGPRRHNRWQPCRCAACRAAMARQVKGAALRKHRGVPSYLDRQMVAAHIRRLLAAGWSRAEIGAQADVAPRTLYDILNERVVQVRIRHANAVLALRPEDAPGFVPAFGAARRLRAMAAMGWSLEWSAAQVGASYTALRDVCCGKTKRIRRSQFEAIDRLYREHALREGPSEVARYLARAKRWPTALAWDEIDNPQARPQMARRVQGDGGCAPDPIDVQRVARLTALGRTNDQIAAELGCHRRTVTRARRRAEAMTDSNLTRKAA